MTVRWSRASEPRHPDLLKTTSMRIPRRQFLSFVLLLSLCAMSPVVFQANAAEVNAARTMPDTSDLEKRQKALALFSQGNRLEALPLLEELVQRSPQHAELLADLA